MYAKQYYMLQMVVNRKQWTDTQKSCAIAFLNTIEPEEQERVLIALWGDQNEITKV